MENIKSTVEHLQDLIDARNDMKSSINNKGVQVSGGLMSYAYAIDRIPQTIVNEGDLKVGMIDVEYTSNGQYNINPVNYKYDALSGVNLNINVPIKKVGLGSPTTIKENGPYTINAKDYGYDGLSLIPITVNVPQTGSDLNVGSAVVSYTSNGSYTVNPSDFSCDALSKVNITVNVPTKSIGTNISSILQIKSNGLKIINAKDYGYDGLSQVHIMTNVPTKSLTTTAKEFTENGQYTIKASDYSVDGLSQIDLDINVPPVIIGGGSEIDFTQVGWSQEDSDEANMREQEYINHAMQYTLEKYGSELDALEFENYGDEVDVKISPFIDDYRIVIVPKIINLDKIKRFKTPSSGGSYLGLFQRCYSLRHIPVLDTSNITDMNSMFYACDSLTTIPLLNTSKVTDMGSMFGLCSALKSIPLLNTSKVTNMQLMFYACNSLTTIPKIDTSIVYAMNRMFEGCESLSTIPILDTSEVTSMTRIFDYCSSLKNIGGFTNLSVSLDLSYCKLLTIESLENITNTVATVTDMPTLTFNEEWLIQLSDEYPDRVENAIITLTDKGWEVMTS